MAFGPHYTVWVCVSKWFASTGRCCSDYEILRGIWQTPNGKDSYKAPFLKSICTWVRIGYMLSTITELDWATLKCFTTGIVQWSQWVINHCLQPSSEDPGIKVESRCTVVQHMQDLCIFPQSSAVQSSDLTFLCGSINWSYVHQFSVFLQKFWATSSHMCILWPSYTCINSLIKSCFFANILKTPVWHPLDWIETTVTKVCLIVGEVAFFAFWERLHPGVWRRVQ